MQGEIPRLRRLGLDSTDLLCDLGGLSASGLQSVTRFDSISWSLSWSSTCGDGRSTSMWGEDKILTQYI